MPQSIRAIVVDPTSTDRLVIHRVEPPQAQPHQAIVDVAAISLNRGEVRRSLSAAAGWRPGWDLAGTIAVAAADGSGFPVGTRIVGFLAEGAWAQQVALAADAMAALPDRVSFAQAATLPVAGLTALLALERGGSLRDRALLITGASGGVGYFACQLAAQAGAIVTAQVRRPESVEFATLAGAKQVIVGNGIDRHGPYDLALDSTGGELLPRVLDQLAIDGSCILFGTTAGADITFNASRFYGKGGLSLYGFILFHELQKQPASRGLHHLVNLVAEGSLVPHIAVEAPWDQIAEVAQKLTDRQFLGKAVLHLG